jgi:O-antigen/teichoic acid export membrane protein
MNLMPTFVLRRIAHRPELVKIIDNIGWLFFDKILRMGVGLFVGVWVARYLGPEQFGLFNFSTAFTALFGAVATLGLQGIVVRDIVNDPSCKEETLGTAALLHLIGGTLAYGLTIGGIFWVRPDDPLARTLVAIVGSIMLLKASEVAAYWFESQVHSKYTVWVQNTVFLAMAATKVVLILNHATLIAFAWVVFFEAVVVALILLFVMGLRGPSLSNLRVSVHRAKTLLSDSWPLILSSLAITIYMKIDQIMLGQMLNDEAVGTYSAAVRLSEVWYFIPVSINASVCPSFYKTRNESKKKFLVRFQKHLDIMVWISVPIAILCLFLSGPLISVLFGKSYSGAADILKIHIGSAIFVFLNNAIWIWYLAEGYQKIANIRIIFGLILNVLLNYLLIPHYGAIGSAWATLISRGFVAYIGQVFSPKTRIIFIMVTKSLLTFGLYRLKIR